MYITILSTNAFSVDVSNAVTVASPCTVIVGAVVYPAPAFVTVTAVIVPSELIVAVAVATFANQNVGLLESGSVFSGSLIINIGAAYPKPPLPIVTAVLIGPIIVASADAVSLVGLAVSVTVGALA